MERTQALQPASPLCCVYRDKAVSYISYVSNIRSLPTCLLRTAKPKHLNKNCGLFLVHTLPIKTTKILGWRSQGLINYTLYWPSIPSWEMCTHVRGCSLSPAFVICFEKKGRWAAFPGKVACFPQLKPKENSKHHGKSGKSCCMHDLQCWRKPNTRRSKRHVSIQTTSLLALCGALTFVH